MENAKLEKLLKELAGGEAHSIIFLAQLKDGTSQIFAQGDSFSQLGLIEFMRNKVLGDIKNGGVKQ